MSLLFTFCLLLFTFTSIHHLLMSKCLFECCFKKRKTSLLQNGTMLLFQNGTISQYVRLSNDFPSGNPYFDFPSVLPLFHSSFVRFPFLNRRPSVRPLIRRDKPVRTSSITLTVCTPATKNALITSVYLTCRPSFD